MRKNSKDMEREIRRSERDQERDDDVGGYPSAVLNLERCHCEVPPTGEPL